MTRTTLPRLLGSARAPILAILAGVGFVVQGWTLVVDPGMERLAASGAVEVARSRTDATDPSDWRILPAGRAIDTPGHPAESISGVQALTGGPDTRNLRDRGPGGSGSGAPPAAVRGTSIPGPAPSSLADPSSPAGSARSVAARDALIRAGRLGAPSTAPPVPSF